MRSSWSWNPTFFEDLLISDVRFFYLSFVFVDYVECDLIFWVEWNVGICGLYWIDLRSPSPSTCHVVYWSSNFQLSSISNVWILFFEISRLRWKLDMLLHHYIFFFLEINEFFSKVFLRIASFLVTIKIESRFNLQWLFELCALCLMGMRMLLC